jgi:hypothetical protein
MGRRMSVNDIPLNSNGAWQRLRLQRRLSELQLKKLKQR